MDGTSRMSNHEPEPNSRQLARRRTRHKRDSGEWIRLVLISSIGLWLAAVIALPLGQIFLKATHADFRVQLTAAAREDRTVTGIEIGTRTVVFGKNRETVTIGERTLPFPEDEEITHEGISVHRRDDYVRVMASRVEVHGELLRVEPITIEVRGQNWFVDGQQLDEDEDGRPADRYIGFVNFFEYFGTPHLRESAWNSMKVGLLTTAISVVLAFFYAYGLTRTKMKGKTFFRVVAMLPLFAPTMLYGLSLVYLFGNKGVITTGFFEHPTFAWMAWDIGLYGLTGVVLAEVLFTFPPALMILTVALSNTDARLYEAASSLGASRIRIFFTVTLPSIKYGLMSAVFVCFTLSFTDFGAPKILGGKGFSVLAVEIYKQVVGQQNFGMGATVSIILLVPAVISFIADQLVRRRQAAAITAQSVLLSPKKRSARDWGMFAVCAAITSYILLVLFTAGYASLVERWPYDFSLTLKHYSFDDVGVDGYGAYWNSIKVAAVSATVGTVLAFLAAYFNEKSSRLLWMRRCVQFLAIIPLALPGLVIGIAYILFFNRPSLTVPFTALEIPNPFNHLYGTIWILVIANVVHFFTVSFLTASTALRQLDREFETVSESMSIPFYVTFFRVTVPVCLPAIIEIAVYLFVSSMATVSAVIFLYSAADMPLASVAVVDIADFGYEAEASAMCMLIVLTNVGARLLSEGVSHVFRRRTQAWRKR